MAIRLTVVLLTAFLCAPTAFGQNAQNVWNSILNSRLQIRSGYLELSHRILQFNGESDHELCRGYTKYEIWFDGSKCRYDASVLQSLTGRKNLTTSNLSFRRVMIEEKILNCPNCDSTSVAGDEFSGPILRLYPPIALGCVEGGLSSLMDKDNTLLLSFRQMFSGFKEIESTERDLCFRSDAGYICMGLDMHSRLPKLIEVDWQHGYYHTKTEVTWKLVETTELPIWFPQKVKYMRSRNAELVEQHVTEVVSSTLNSPIDPKVFTWEGMRLPEGKLVSKTNAADEVVELIDGSFRKKDWPNPKSVTILPSARSGRLIAAFIGLVALFALILVRKFMSSN